MKRIFISIAGGVVTTALIFVVALSVMYLMSGGGRSLRAESWVDAACFWAIAWPLPLSARVFGTFGNAFSDHAPTPLALLAALLCHVTTYSLLVYVALWH